MLFEEPTCKPDGTLFEQNEQRSEHHAGYIQQKHCHKPPDPVEDGKGNWQGERSQKPALCQDQSKSAEDPDSKHGRGPDDNEDKGSYLRICVNIFSGSRHTDPEPDETEED